MDINMDQTSIYHSLSGDMGTPKSPPRRRRPALSCITCRRRKLKCNRGVPCTQCVKSKTPESCEYVAPPKGQSNEVYSAPEPPCRPAPGYAGLYVFDSKHKSSNRVTKPVNRVDEMHELRSRIQALENALSRPGLYTPETSGFDAFSEVGSRHVESDHIADEIDGLPPGCFRGKRSGSRYCGRSHWTVSMAFFKDDVGEFLRGVASLKSPNSDYMAVRKFKKEIWTREREEHQRAYRDHAFRLEGMLPPKKVADELLQLYLSTIETTYRILHVPTFLKQYEEHWSDPEPSDMVFIAKLLALMAASSCFYSQNTRISEGNTLQKAAMGWTMAVHSWINSVFVSSNINYDMLQIQCLLMIARQANAADGDLIWISSGSLIRSAMRMGLHRDPQRFRKVNKYWAEMRRRLWATITELDLQSAIDGGMLPSVDLDECDCDPPANIDDLDLTEDMEDPVPRSIGELTRNSVQTFLSRSLPIRIRIAKLVNSLRFNLSYDEALRLSEDISQSMNEALSVFQGATDENMSFAKSFYVFIMRRYLLVLHRPFSVRVLQTPKYSYSRKMCLESSLEMLSLLGPPSEYSNTVPYPHLGQLSGGMFRDELFHAAVTVCVELRIQANEGSKLPFSEAPSGSLDNMVQSQQTVMIQAVERTVDTFGSRITPEGRGIKSFFFLSLVVTAVKARLGGEDSLESVEQHSNKVMRECKEIMNGTTWGEIRRGDNEQSLGTVMASPIDTGFDPTTLLSDDLGFFPMDFGNLFDMADYTEFWGNDFWPGFSA